MIGFGLVEPTAECVQCSFGSVFRVGGHGRKVGSEGIYPCVDVRNGEKGAVFLNFGKLGVEDGSNRS